MRLREQIRVFLRYLAAIVASWAAIGLVAAIQPHLGYLPILFVPIIVLLDFYLDLGPAVAATVVCTFGSLLLMGQRDYIPEEIHNLANLAVLPLVAGTLLRLIEQRKRQKAIDQERLAELSTLLESMPGAVLIFSPTGQVVDVNRAAAELAAVSRQELIGMHLRDLVNTLTIQPESSPLELRNLAVVRALRGEIVRHQRRIFLRKDSSQGLEAIVSASPMRNSEGAIVGALVVVRDITEITALQKHIADTERHLAIGQMAAGIAHDFNNVLGTISQAVGVLEVRPDQNAEERKVVLRMISNGVRRGTEIIGRLREYIRGGTGEQTMVDVRRTMEEALDLTRPLWHKDRRIAVVTEFSPVPPVKANVADLRRVFTNLILNAIQAMPEGGRLTLHCEPQDARVIAWVRDTGSGIAPDQQKNIFMPYYTTKVHGTGLGLSGAQKVIVAQHGSIRFESQPGEGTTFIVDLPVMELKEESAQVA